MKIYRVKDWSKHFENNRTKELVRMSWVPMPNKMDGDGYTQLLDHEEGAGHFGAWCAIVEIASKCEPRGTLLRPDPSSPSGTSAHTARSLARISRIPESVFVECLPRLVSIGWLEVIEIPQEGATISQEGAPAPQVVCARAPAAGNGTEWNGMERKDNAPAVAVVAVVSAPVKSDQQFPDGFIQFWSMFPRRGKERSARKKALAAWEKQKLEPRKSFVIDALAAWIRSDVWTKQDGQFVCAADRWLRDEKFEEVPIPASAQDNPDEFAPNRYDTPERLRELTESLPTKAELERIGK